MASEFAGRKESLGVADLEHPVEDLEFRTVDDLFVAQPLEQIPTLGRGCVGATGESREVTAEHGSFDIDRHDLNRRVPLLQKTAHPGNRTAGADAADEDVDPALHLPPDLRSRRLVVALVVVPVVVLVREESSRLGRRQTPGLPVVRLRVLGVQITVDQDEFDPQSPQAIELLAAGLAADDGATAQPASGGHHGQAHCRVAGGRLDHQSAGLERAGRERTVHQVARDPVLHAAHRVEELELGEHLDAGAGVAQGTPETHHGRTADRLAHVLADAQRGSRGLVSRRVQGSEDYSALSAPSSRSRTTCMSSQTGRLYDEFRSRAAG